MVQNSHDSTRFVQTSNRLVFQLKETRRSFMFSTKTIFDGVKRNLPTLSLSGMVLLAVSHPAFAQTIDTGNITAQTTALITLFKFIGAACAVAALIFAALAIRGRNIGEGIVGVVCAILAIFIIGHASDWVSSITGVAVGG
jgi:hypothetical protein